MAERWWEKEQRVCQRCGEPFFVIRSWQRFCSQKCALTEYNKTHDVAEMLRKSREKKKKKMKK